MKIAVLESDIKLKCDYNQLSRVFLNILKNSYESLNKNAKFISVKVSDGKGFIDIYIEDNGDGFPENRDKLFEPYITNKIDGTGLGLAICKKIIEDHGGEIYLLNSDDFGGEIKHFWLKIVFDSLFCCEIVASV